MSDINDKIRAAFTNGHLVSLSIGGPSWKVPLAQEELKVKATNVHAGHRKVLQGAAVNKPELIESRARGVLDKFCIPCPIGRGCRFVADRNIGELLMLLQEMKGEYLKSAKELRDSYEDVKAEMEIQFPDQVDKLRASWIPVDQWKPYYFHVTVTTMTIPKTLGGLEADALLEKYREDETKRKLLEDAIREQARAEAVVLREMTETTIRSLRETVIKTFTTILEQKTKRAGDGVGQNKFHAKNLTTLRETIADIRRLDVLGDQGMQTSLDRIIDRLDSSDTSLFTSDTSAARELESILQSTVTNLTSGTEDVVAHYTSGFGESTRRQVI